MGIACLLPAMPHGRRVDEDVEAVLRKDFVLEGFGFGLARQGNRIFVGAVDDEHFCAAFDEPENGGTCCAAGAEHGNLRAAERSTLLERTKDAGNIGVEADDLAVCADAECIAGADAGRERVGVGKVRKDLLLERHGDGGARQREFAEDFDEVRDAADLERKQHGIQIRLVEGRVVHQWRERVSDRVAGDAEESRGPIELLGAIEVPQVLGGELARCGAVAVGGRGKCEGRAGAKTEDAAEKALFSHGDADDFPGAGFLQ